MIQIKNAAQVAIMKEAGRITGEALCLAGEAVREGVSTKYLDDIIYNHIVKSGAKPSFLGYGGFRGSACISINDEVIHGIPSKDRIIQSGDIVKIDVGAFYKGFHGDSANTFAVGNVSDEAKRLIEAAKDSFEKAIKAAIPGNRIGDIGNAIEEHVKKCGFSVVRQFVGHGIGKELHEDPSVPNYGTKGHGPKLYKGMALAIEPMVNAGTADVYVLPDGWTVKTKDGKLSAHYEHTNILTDDGIISTTRVN